MYNLDDSIRDFARSSLRYGLDRRYPVYLSTKNTILKAYDGRFKDLFAEVFEAEFAGRVRGRRHHLRAPPDRRHGRRRAEVGGRLRLGLQELRRRRAVRHRRAGLRLARPDDVGADDGRRQDGGGGGGARHGHAPLPRTGSAASRRRPTRSRPSSRGRAGSSTAPSSTTTPARGASSPSTLETVVDPHRRGRPDDEGPRAAWSGRDQPWLETIAFMDAIDANLQAALA